jgi:hypothetical protein
MAAEAKTNIFLRERTAADIDKYVAKVLRDLDNPQPPLRLEVVREILHLDRAYYSSADSGVLHETFHRLKMAGKQILRDPMRLLDAVRKFSLKALWLPDRKRILIDSELPAPKQRWSEAHEIGHSLIPWHDSMAHGDAKLTLSPACAEQIEAEANFAAGRLLFLRGDFNEHLRSSAMDFDHVRALSQLFSNTMTSTLWRAVESMDEPAVGLVTVHPRGVVAPGTDPVRYFIRSKQFAAQFPGVTGNQLFQELRTFCFGKRGPIGASEVVLVDANGQGHVFFFEAFNNSHDVLTLGLHRGPRQVIG